MNRAQRVLSFLLEREGIWIDAIQFESLGGRRANRTAISEARAAAKLLGKDIENMVVTVREHDPGCMGDVHPKACICGYPVVRKDSLYRLVKVLPVAGGESLTERIENTPAAGQYNANTEFRLR